MEQIVLASELIVIAEVLSYSRDFFHMFGGTTVEVLDILYARPDLDPPEMLRIKNWVAYDPPLYVHKKGDVVLLYLRKEDWDFGNQFHVSNMSWGQCVPGISYVDLERRLIPLGYWPSDGESEGFLSYDDFKEMLQEAFQR